MATGNAKLSISFDFDVTLPDEWSDVSQAQLMAKITDALGPTVFGGMPTVTRKQLAKAGITMETHTSHSEVVRTTVTIPTALVAKAAPHLNDGELAKVAQLAAAKLPQKPAEQFAHIRRVALKFANDYRLVDCRLAPEQSIGGIIEMTAQLNLTNGGVLVDDEFKKIKLKSDQGPIAIRIGDTPVVLQAKLGGHTLGGPLLEVDIHAIAAHRDTLMARWQAAHA